VGKDFIPGYFELLSVGGSMDQVEALKRYVGVDLTDSGTIRGALDYVAGLVAQLRSVL
jgi:oligoendopeptidase F